MTTDRRVRGFASVLAVPSVAVAASGGALLLGATFRSGPAHVMSLRPVRIVPPQDQSFHQGPDMAAKDTRHPARNELADRAGLQTRKVLPVIAVLSTST